MLNQTYAMEGFFVDSIYEDIVRRTDGDIYIGVVGPVRTGKSTFIKRFMETLVIPNIENVYRKERARDELPQSGSGRTIMTAEPKFVPDEAVEIQLGESTAASIRMIDCVGYMVPGAEGLFENGAERMVTTPWYDREISMTQAAEEGTRKVIAEHSTIGLVITTDGSFGDIPRENYLTAEERVILELQEIGKPFAILLNSAEPHSDSALALATELSGLYNVPCIPVNCLELSEKDIHRVLEAVLFQFPLMELSITLPPWTEALPEEDELKKQICAMFLDASDRLETLHDSYRLMEHLQAQDGICSARVIQVQPGLGAATVSVELESRLYYDAISAQSGFEIHDENDLMELLRSLRTIKTEYDHVHEALEQVRETGYGVIRPGPEDMVLEEPQIVSRGGRYSVRLKASAPAIHLFQTQVETEVSPAVGGEKASEEIVSFLLQGFDGDMNRIWESNIFGKSLYDIAEDGLTAKLHRMPLNVRNRLRITMQKLVNDGGCGLICFIL